MNPLSTQAVILVGGKGTRLKELSKNTPKPLLPVGEKPFLDYLIKHLGNFGFNNILLLAGHLSDQITNRYDGKTLYGCKLNVIKEVEPLGTAGSLLNARRQLNSSFLMLNGDSFFDINLLAFCHRSRQSPSLATLALNRVQDISQFGAVTTKSDNIINFNEKNLTGSGLVNAGIYYINKDILDIFPDEKNISMENEIFPKLVDMNLIDGFEFSSFFIDIGSPNTYEYATRTLQKHCKKPAVFFDRDGVLNKDTGHPHKKEKFIWLKGAKQAVKAAIDSGFHTFVVTNQAGVAKGFYSEEAILELHKWMQNELREFGGSISQYYYCPHHPAGIIDQYKKNCQSRKPNPGMIERAISDWDIDRANSILFGDKLSDIEAAQRANIKSILVSDNNLYDLVKHWISEETHKSGENKQ